MTFEGPNPLEELEEVAGILPAETTANECKSFQNIYTKNVLRPPSNGIVSR
jgi:hypothetical protein